MNKSTTFFNYAKGGHVFLTSYHANGGQAVFRLSSYVLLITFLIMHTTSFVNAQENIITKLNSMPPNAPQATAPNTKIIDTDGNILMQVTDEGSAGSIYLNSLPTPPSTNQYKIYNVGTKLYWNGSPLGTSGNAGGWVNSISKIHTEDESKEVGIGTTGPSDKLHVKAGVGQNALRVQVGSSTKLRVLSNGGTSIGTNNTSPPQNGLYVRGRIVCDSTITSTHLLYTQGALMVGSTASRIQRIEKIIGTTSSNNNTSQIAFPYGFDWINTQVIALKIKDASGKYKAISMDANDAFSITLSPFNDIELIVPNNNFRNKLYQMVLMRIDD